MNPKMIKSYVKQTLAFLAGDSETVQAERNWQRAVGHVKGQLAALDAQQPDLEIKVSEASDNLTKAKYGVEITSAKQYLIGIINAKEALEQAEQDVKDLEESREFYKGLLEEFLKEEPADN